MTHCPIYQDIIYQDAFDKADKKTKMILIFYHDYNYKNLIINPEIDYVVYFLQHYNPICIIDIYKIKKSLDDFLILKDFIHNKESIIISNIHLIEYYFGQNYIINDCRKILCNELKKYKNCEKLCKHCSSNPSLVTIKEYNVKLIKPKKQNSFDNLKMFFKNKI